MLRIGSNQAAARGSGRFERGTVMRCDPPELARRATNPSSRRAPKVAPQDLVRECSRHGLIKFLKANARVVSSTRVEKRFTPRHAQGIPFAVSLAVAALNLLFADGASEAEAAPLEPLDRLLRVLEEEDAAPPGSELAHIREELVPHRV